MIRRVVEYIIVCDGERVFTDGCVGTVGGHAFGALTAAECSESAAKYGWRQLSKRLWLCPQCAKKYDELAQKQRAAP